jgi:hypothetical protein
MKRLLLAAGLALFALISTAASLPQGTAFTYQGTLSANGHPASGNFDLAFNLFDAATGGAQVGSTVSALQFPVANGAFTIDLDFPGAFTGNQLWLEVTVGTQTLVRASRSMPYLLRRMRSAGTQGRQGPRARIAS